MSVDILKLKALAAAAKRDQYDCEALNDYGMAMAPAVTLDLIAEIERHRQVEAEGCKPEISNRPVGGHTSDAPTIDKPDLNILPCPFCGGMADSRCSAGPDPDWWVECTECKASAPIFSEEKLGGWNNRTQPAMALDLSIIAQAMGFEPGEQPGEEGIAIAIRVLRTQLAYLGKHLWDLQEYCELSPSVRKKVEAAISGAADPRKLSTAACDVLSERLRQEEVEGWHPDGDDAHTACEMAVAAALYALYSDCYPQTGEPPKGWPWDPSWWKPKNYRTDLVRAGALILAEIERLDRMPQSEVLP